MKVYNSLTNKIEPFIPKIDNQVNMYVCGPTVYDDIHIGNGRPVIFFDILKRYLTYKGYHVTYATNITDIDDKIIDKALNLKIDEKTLSETYANAFMKVLNDLKVEMPDYLPHATNYISEMTHFILKLIEKDYAYETNSGVYFRVNKISPYGVLSNQKLEDLREGVRITLENKENPMDFALWKKTKVGLSFDSPWGLGRPGWHTECVVMNFSLFDDNLDIHGGGFDLKFPHHENEIAQSVACRNHHLAKYWMHVGRLDFNDDKMSKSLGNIIKIKDLLEKYDANSYRLLLLAHHYRNPINFSYDLQEQYQKMYERITQTINKSLFKLTLTNEYNDEEDEIYISKFEEYMDNDLNTSLVISLIDEIIKELNKTPNYRTFNSLIKILNVLGVAPLINNPTKEDIDLYYGWEEDRKNKDFVNADKKREYLSKKGWL